MNGRPSQKPTEPESKPARVVVVGAGIAGLSAATILAEAEVSVTLIERESYLGGRAGAWTDRLQSGEPFEMERGFHAFFRQYYNLRALLRRVDPNLSFLRPLDDYPILGPAGQRLSFKGVPRRTPWNVIELARRAPQLSWINLLRVDKRRALEMLTFDSRRTYARRDEMSAKEYLDSLNFPPEARRLLFEVFAHSFFNPEKDMSAGELLMMFHFYLTGNPKGLVFDVVDAPFSRAVWEPLGSYLRAREAELLREESVETLGRTSRGAWTVTTNRRQIEADGVVLALDVSALQGVVKSSPSLDDPRWREQIGSLQLTRPFAVWRLWLDRPTRAERSPFVGTTGLGALDNISLYHCFEDESRDWAERTGGAVVELHAYAVDPNRGEKELRHEMLEALYTLYPETRDAAVQEERWLWRQDCPAFHRGSHHQRPGVETPFDGLTLAGDFVKLNQPSALMERATTTGMLAANSQLARLGREGIFVESIAPRGIFASLTVA